MKKLNGPLTLRRTLIGLVAIAAAGTTIMVFAKGIGYRIDLPVFRSEFIAQVQPLNEARLLQLDVRLFEIKASILKIQRQGQPVPRAMIEQRNLLIRQVDAAQKRANALRQ